VELEVRSTRSISAVIAPTQNVGRSISAVIAPTQNVGWRWESPERLPSAISSWRRAHGESGVEPTHHFTWGNRCLKLKALLFLGGFVGIVWTTFNGAFTFF